MVNDKRHVVVEWVDVNCYAGWTKLDQMDTVACWSCGWLELEDDKKLILAGTYSEDGEYNQAIAIPRGMVVSIKDL